MLRVSRETGYLYQRLALLACGDKGIISTRERRGKSVNAGPVTLFPTFAYGDDVQAPKGAIKSDNLRRWLAQQGLLMYQKPGTSGVGPVLSGTANHR